MPPRVFSQVRYHPIPAARKNVLGWDVAPFGIHRLVKVIATDDP